MRAFLLVVCAGCIEPALVPCEDGRDCPAGTVCDDVHHSCVRPDQLSACTGLAQFDACMADDVMNGSCYDGVCLQDGCGNGILDPGELCDDGNTISGDGCSADCLSREICGDGFVDRDRGEQCDDGNLRGHDGCTSVCTTEIASWRLVGQIAGRTNPIVGYDTIRGRLVVFSGVDATDTLLDTTAEWNGAMWELIGSELSPPARTSSAMVYDPVRHRMVLFSGFGASSVLDDTWEWDGNEWSHAHPTTSPPYRYDHAMGWDPVSKRVLVFGGLQGPGGYLDDTWAWDGTNWTQITSTASPSPRDQALMAVDATTGRAVLSGGYNNGAVLDTWTFDGSQWTLLASTVPQILGAITYDPELGAVVGIHQIGGNGTAMFKLAGSTWQSITAAPAPATAGVLYYDDAAHALVNWVPGTMTMESLAAGQWSGALVQTMPPARSAAVVSYDPARGRLVLFGGNTPGTSYADTWELDRTGWTQLLPTTSPLHVDYSAMAFDGHATVLVGGRTGPSTYTNATWTWNGVTWTAAATGPSARYEAAIAFDSTRGRVVLFGGGNDTMAFADTWLWDGAAWQQLAPSASPPARLHGAMTFDSVRGKAVLFGGSTASGTALGDTWEWDGTTWAQIATPIAPIARAGHSLVFDSARERTVLFGGNDNFDQWEWDGAQWSELATDSVPNVFFDQTAAYDPARAETVMTGDDTFYADPIMWTFAYRGDAEEVCGSELDVDGDGLIGCADPDCTPFCAQCGDATCEPLENGNSCPADCPAVAPVCGDDACAPNESCPGDCE